MVLDLLHADRHRKKLVGAFCNFLTPPNPTEMSEALSIVLNTEHCMKIMGCAMDNFQVLKCVI
jgi:hypothetical protein